MSTGGFGGCLAVTCVDGVIVGFGYGLAVMSLHMWLGCPCPLCWG